MSISCKPVKDSEVTEKIKLYGAKEFVHVNVEPNSRDQFPFPRDYNFETCLLPKKYEKYADRIHNFKVRSDDVWVVTFPKVGTTWAMNIAWQLQNNLSPPVKFVSPSHMFLDNYLCFDENYGNKNDDVYNRLAKNVDTNLNEIENEPSPRLIKTHLPAHLLPKDIWTVKPKIIYMHRNAKDVAISMYHMFRNFKYLNYQGTMEDFFEDFLNDRVIYAPFFAHVNGFRKLNKDYILLLNYDEMKSDQFSGIKKISQFLGFSYTDDQLEQLTQSVSFENLWKYYDDHRSKYGFNFLRRGQSGAYRDEMSSRYIETFDKWEQENQN